MSVQENSLTPEYVAVLKKMSGIERVRQGIRLYLAAKELKKMRIRQLHPEWTEEQVKERVDQIFLKAS
jgi:hypothetical protein